MTMKPLNSTVRVLDWEELPARAREIPEGFNPLDEGVLMRHQAEFLSMKHSIIAVPKGRRTGMTFAKGLDSTLIAASRRSAGGDNVFYIGDTKEKGLEFIGYCAKFARVIAEAQGQGVSGIEEFLFEDQDERGNSKNITAYRIRFSSGFQVTALSSRPANIRGLQGIVVIDEAAFHQDVQGVLDAATALLIWGGKIVVISSHNGKGNPFNQFCKDIEEGRYGDDAVVYTVTFDNAVENGLYERVCMMKRDTPTAEGKLKWYSKIRNSYGPRKAAMREELDAVPRDGSGVCLPGVWVDASMREERPVVRLVLDDDFVTMSDDERRAWCHAWITQHLDPLLDELDPRYRWVFGDDYARHRDFSIFVPLGITGSLSRYCPWVVELQNVPTRQQEQIKWHIIERLPNWRGGAMDATGSGQILAEYTADKFGHEAVHQIMLSRAWYGLWMPKMIQWFEDGVIDLPRDANLESDLRAIVDVDGIPMIPGVRKADLKEPELYRHGDFAIALALACFASLNQRQPIPIDYLSTGPRPSMTGLGTERPATELTDTGFGTVAGTNDFRGF
jgi:phage FluMu gp28-like protein